jgi:hypothetical protein
LKSGVDHGSLSQLPRHKAALDFSGLFRLGGIVNLESS